MLDKHFNKKIVILANACTLIATTPAHADTLSEGIEHYNKHEYKLAIQSLDKSIAANPKSPTPLYYEAMSYYGLGNFDKAKALYTTIYSSFPKSEEAKYASMYLQRVDAKFAAAVGSAPGKLAAAQAGRSATNGAGAATPMRDLTTFEAANATSQDLDKLPDQGNVPFSHGPGGHLFVDVQINGRTVKMMFDTGASTCLIGKNQLEQAGVQVNTIKGQSTTMGGVGSKVNLAAPMMVDIRVGGIGATCRLWYKMTTVCHHFWAKLSITDISTTSTIQQVLFDSRRKASPAEIKATTQSKSHFVSSATT